MTRYAAITGWGKYVPERIMTNVELSTMVDTSDEWIRTRTGIERRHIADPKEATSDLATKAAWAALQCADVDPNELDLIIVATCTPDYHIPNTACQVQDSLGASRAGAFDLNAACSGFVYALSMASQAIISGGNSNVLVIGAETLSRFVDWTQRDTCVLFGDGAGAVVLQASDKPSGLLSFVLGSDGSGGELLIMRNGGTRVPPKGIMSGDGGIHMNGKEVYRFATRVMGKAAKEAIDRARLVPDDISLFIPHQANLRIIDSAAKHLGIPMERVFVNVQNYGNTSSASIPIALCEAIEEGRMQPGDNICVVGFGAGLTWAAATIRWAPPQPTPQQSFSRRLMRLSRYPLARVRSLINRAERKIDSLEERLERQKQLANRLRPGHHSNGSNGNGAGSHNTQPKLDGPVEEREKTPSR